MTDPRNPRRPRTPPTDATIEPEDAASDTDLAASTSLDEWLRPSTRPDAAPTGRAGAMLEARNVLRSNEDAASSGELDALVESALGQLHGRSSPHSRDRRSIEADMGHGRRRAVRWQRFAGAAAAVVVIVGLGALALRGTGLEESADDAGSTAATAQSAATEDHSTASQPDAATTTARTGLPKGPPAPEQHVVDESPEESTELTEGAAAGGPASEDQDATADNQDGGTPSPSFAGVHAVGRVELRG